MHKWEAVAFFYEVEDIVNPSDVPPFKQLTSMAEEISEMLRSDSLPIHYDLKSIIFYNKNSNLDI